MGISSLLPTSGLCYGATFVTISKMLIIGALHFLRHFWVFHFLEVSDIVTRSSQGVKRENMQFRIFDQNTKSATSGKNGL